MTTAISVLIPTKNEAANIEKCLGQLHGWADEIIVVDSQSEDNTTQIAQSFGAKIVQFYYSGGLPKKRQWALDNYPFRNGWILLLDADEILEEPIKNEISAAIKTMDCDGYWLRFQIYFLGRQLKYGDTQLWKLFLFRKGKGRYEKRLDNQDGSMSDIEVHEHIILNGKAGHLGNPIRHENINSMSRYIIKHNEYSNWEARVLVQSYKGEIKPSLFGSQAERRRWLKLNFLKMTGSPICFFLYKYLLKRGFMDGRPGLIYCLFQAVQVFHTKTKMYEIRNNERPLTEKRRDPILFHDNLAVNWESKYRKPSFQNRMKAILSLLDGNDLANQIWLDAGCGAGVLARALTVKGCSVIGVDASLGMIQAARNSKPARNDSPGEPVFEVVETIERLDFEPASFDGVVCSSVLEYVVDPNEAIAQFNRVLKPGGILLVSVPNKTSLLRNTQQLMHIIFKRFLGINSQTYLEFSKHTYTSDSFSSLLRKNGFKIESARSYGPYVSDSISGIQYFSSILIFLAKRDPL